MTVAKRNGHNLNLNLRYVFVRVFAQDNNGIIEREDLKRFSFSFSVVMGNIKNLVPGVKVHFTVFKNKVSPFILQLFGFYNWHMTDRSLR